MFNERIIVTDKYVEIFTKLKQFQPSPALKSTRDGIRFYIFGCLPFNSVEVKISPDDRSAPVDQLSDRIKFDTFGQCQKLDCLAVSNANLC